MVTHQVKEHFTRRPWLKQGETKWQTQIRVKVIYGVSGDHSQLNLWLHFILYKHTQAETQIMTSSANLGFMLQLQTKHRQWDGVSVSA